MADTALQMEKNIPVEPVFANGTTECSPDCPICNTWLDRFHRWLYGSCHAVVEHFDQNFVPEGKEGYPTPPSRFRLGIFNQVELDAERDVEWAPLADFDVRVDLPNVSRRFSLFLSTEDPTALPGDDPIEGDKDLRVGANRGFLRHLDFSVGAKVRKDPELFSYLQWAPAWRKDRNWKLYPKLKGFWESDEEFGGISSIAIGRWRKNHHFRQTFSLKWSEYQAEKDESRAEDPEDVQFGDDAQGYRWRSNSLFGYFPELMESEDYGRRVGEGDVAKGLGLRFFVQGSFDEILEGRVTLFGKHPIYKKKLYALVAPEVVFHDDDDFEASYNVKFGIELYMWGDDPAR